MIVYRKKDRVKVKIDDIKVELSPLTLNEKTEAQRLIVSREPSGAMKGSVYALKCAIKKVEGLKLSDGSDYELEFENDMLTDECVDDLSNLGCADKLYVACLGLLNGVPEKFVNPETGEELSGVEILKEEKPEESKEKKSGC